MPQAAIGEAGNPPMNVKNPPLRKLTIGAAIAASFYLSAAQAAEPVAGGERQVPLKTDLPKALFQNTPKDIKPSPTLEKYSEAPRPDFYVPEGVKNLALHKKVTSSDSAPIIGELNLVTDGDKDGSDGSFVELAPGKQWIQIDLEKAAGIYAVLIWHYHGEGRIYHGVVVQVSDDPDFKKDVKTIFNNDFANTLGFEAGKQLEYIDDYRGKLIDAKNAKGEPVRGRYVRCWSNGNSSNDQNHYIEIEVWGK